MSVLPQLERELRDAQVRRSGDRRRPFLGWLAVAAAAAIVALVVVVAASVGGRAPRPHRTAGGRPWTKLVIQHADYLQAYAGGGALYVAEGLTERQRSTRLVVLDPRTGRADASLALGAPFDDALLAGGCLWVTTTSFGPRRDATTTLWRLVPDSLGVISRRRLPGTAATDGAGSLAAAGGELWVTSSNRLIEVSLTSGQISPSIEFADEQSVAVVANAQGTILLASLGNGQGLGRIVRLNPATGAMLGRSRPFDGVSEPRLGGIIDGGVWMSEATGMAGYVARVDVQTLRETHVAPVLAYGSNGIAAHVLDGVVWISQLAGGSSRNYCGDPVTGRALGLFATRTETQFLTVDSNDVYVYETPVGGNGHEALLIRQRIGSHCRF
jgi:hypothetical protein